MDFHKYAQNALLLISPRSFHGSLTRYIKLLVAHEPEMPGTFPPSPTSKETTSKRSRHASRHARHAHAAMHVGIVNTQCRGKYSRQSRRMRNPEFYVSGKRPMGQRGYLGFVSISHKTCYPEISQSVEGARSSVLIIVWLSNLTGTSAAVLGAIGQF